MIERRDRWVLWCAVALSGCTGAVEPAGAGSGGDPTGAVNTGSVDGSGGSGQVTTATAGVTTGGGGSADTTSTTGSVPIPDPPDVDDIDGVVDPNTLPDGVQGTTQLPRLTHGQYARAVSSLLRIEVDPTTEFPSEAPTLDGYIEASVLRVTERLYLDYQRTAEVLAEQLVNTPAAYEQFVGCSTSDSGCQDQFLSNMLLQAYRRPATTEELSRYGTLFAAGSELVASGDAFRDGVQVVVEAVLQSPHFLYRVERGEGDAASPTPLTEFERAARLAFLLTDSAPDAELLAEAGAGRLATAEELVTQARRLMQMPAFVEKVRDFHARWLQLEGVLGASKDPSLFPEFSVEVARAMQEETLRYVEEATLNQNGAVSALLTGRYTFVNDQLAGIYGLSGSFGSDFQRVDFEAQAGRAGILTQLSFLTGHSSSSTGTSPILRGVYVLRRILCQDISDPPAGAEGVEPPAPAVPPVTTRDFFTWKTSMVACTGCHSSINPVGFAFEGFDALGRARQTENGAPIDSTGTLTLSDDTPLTFADASQLVSQIATGKEVRACYVKHWLRYSHGRPESDLDLRTLALTHRALEAPTFGVRELIEQLVQSAAFSHVTKIAE